MNPPAPVSTRSSSTWSGSSHTDERVGRAERTRDLGAQPPGCDEETERQTLSNELAAINMPVADAVVSRYRSRGVATEALQQVAYLALTKAARRFDPHSGH